MNSEEDKDVQPRHSFEPMERYDSLFPLLPDYVAHYTIGGKRLPRIGLPSKHDLHLRKRLFATLIADRMEISTTYAEKRYPTEITESRWLGLTDRIDLTYGEGRKYLGWYLSFEKDQITSGDTAFRGLSWQFFLPNCWLFRRRKTTV